MSDPRLGHSTLKVLRLFLADPQLSRSGSEICREVGVGSGTLYPMLARLEQAGWLSSAWEETAAQELGRPRRRLYHLTGLGQTKALTVFEDIGAVGGAPSWAS